MRLAVNLLTDNPAAPSGAHWFWTRMIPEIAAGMTDDEQLHLLVSPTSRQLHENYGPRVRYITFPWSNERPHLRTLSEHLYAPARLPASRIDVFSTLMAPIVRAAPGLVVHFKTLHAFTTPEAIPPLVRAYRRRSYPRTARVADAVIINSESLRREVMQHLDVDPAKLRLVPEAVDHAVFHPDDRDEAAAHLSASYGIDKPFVLFVSSLWPYKNCEGLLRAFAAARTDLDDHELVVVGPGRDTDYVAQLHALAGELGIADAVIWVGGVSLEQTVDFYRCAEVLVYPSFNETFGLPILEAMATGCPVVTSDTSAMPETAGGCALLADPHDPHAIADAIVKACGPEGERMRDDGLGRAAQFSWAATARQSLATYREVFAGVEHERGRR